MPCLIPPGYFLVKDLCKVLAAERFKGSNREDKQVICRVFRRKQNNP